MVLHCDIGNKRCIIIYDTNDVDLPSDKTNFILFLSVIPLMSLVPLQIWTSVPNVREMIMGLLQNLWHFSLGHILRGGGVEHLVKEQVLNSLDLLDADNDHRIDCIKGKYVRKLLKKWMFKCSSPLSLSLSLSSGSRSCVFFP